jgi:Mn2+/Fe2+ NRAMP family transporter
MPKSAPTDALGIARQLGPGLIITAIIVGSGELIVTPKLGAANGFSLLWFIVGGCLLKVFTQVALGRHAVEHGESTLVALNGVPGPRWRVSWLLWLWLVMFAALVFQVAGMVGGLASIFVLAGLPVAPNLIAVLIGVCTAALLVVGRYRLVEWISTLLVVLFVVCTLGAVAALQGTSFAITGRNLAEGFAFHLPPSFNTAFAAFGIIGVGASELIYYPYWCLEKGYATAVGPNDGTAGWRERALGWLRVMKVDAWLSFVLYTTTTVAFYLLGAAVLHAKGLVVEDSRMIETLSHMYQATFGSWSLWLFLVGAFAVLYSTVFGATASNARLFVDALFLFGVAKDDTPARRARFLRAASMGLPVAFTAAYLTFGTPVTLVFVGAIAQGLMLPFLGAAAVYFHFRRTHPDLRSGAAFTFFLCASALAMTAVGAYQVVTQLFR